MSRVFPYEDWAPRSQEPRTSMNSFVTPYDPHESSRDSVTIPFRKRLQSLPLVIKDADALQRSPNSSASGYNLAQDDGRRLGGFIGLLRRASVSIKSRQRRHSHAIEQRPQTASPWHRLKTATSFHRHSKVMSTNYDTEDHFDYSEEALSPIPGSGNAPPIIPRNHGGAAARATAARLNEIENMVNRQRLSPPDQLGDRESGIEITITQAEPSGGYADVVITDSITHVDFITSLPAELAIQILAHLDMKTLGRACGVSRYWAEISRSQHIWREVFLREQTKTYATGKPLALGAGLGLPAFKPDNDWRDLYRVREELRKNWKDGICDAIYLNGHEDSIYCLQFDEDKIITGSRDKTIRVWDMKTFACTLVIGPPEVVEDPLIMIGNDEKPRHYATMPDLSRVAECTPRTSSFPIHHVQSILCLQYDDDILVTGSSDATCIVYDVKNGYRPIRRLQHHTGAVLDLAFDDRYIVTCSKDVSICVWDRETGAMLKQLRGHSGPVNAVQLRGNIIVSCSGDFRVKLWNIDTGKNIKELVGHTKGLACSQYSEDSRFIASAGNDKTIRIWDANTGECLNNIPAHDNLVRSLHIDSVSGRLISGSYDTGIKVFDMATGINSLSFPKWHTSWVLGAKSDYRRIVSTGQDPKILIMDFGRRVEGIEKLESSE